jgi:CheY-like chemotaxis protein
MLRLWLSSAGMDVTTANDGVDALDQLARDGFDVVVLDLQMPRMDGRGVCREMTSRGLSGKVVILSAYGAEEARRELGAAAAISKPFDPEVLVETVQGLAQVA